MAQTLIRKAQLNMTELLNFFYPVGTIYETTSTDLDTTTKMGNYFGGTWEAYGEGRVLVAKSSDTEFDTIGETGGAKTVTLTSAQSGLVAHTHSVLYSANSKNLTLNTGGSMYNLTWGTSGANSAEVFAANNSTANAAESHTNLQPYIVVYRYRRTA